MANNYKHHLKETAKEIFLLKNIRDSYLWSKIYRHGKEFFWAVFCLLARILVLIASPISVPLLAYACFKADQSYLERTAKAVAKAMQQRL